MHGSRAKAHVSREWWATTKLDSVVGVTLPDEVRAACADIAVNARSVSIDADALLTLDPGPAPELDRERHYLDGPADAVADYFLTLDTINFGSGWFPGLHKRPHSSGYFTIAWALADRFRRVIIALCLNVEHRVGNPLTPGQLDPRFLSRDFILCALDLWACRRR